MFLSKTAKIVLNIAKEIKSKLEPEETIDILSKADKFIIENTGKLSCPLNAVSFSVNKAFKTPVIPTLCIITQPCCYEKARDPYWNLTAAMIYSIIESNKFKEFVKNDKHLERLLYLVVPLVLLPEREDKVLKELEKTLESLNTSPEIKWLERYGFKPMLFNNTDHWLRKFTTSYIHVWKTDNNKWQANALWYRARGRASMTSKECDSYQDALKEILPGIKELFERENRKLKK